MRLILCLYQWQILIQTMNLLCIYDVHYPPYLFMVSHQGGEQVDDIEADHGGYQGAKSRPHTYTALHSSCIQLCLYSV